MSNISIQLVNTITSNKAEIEQIISQKTDWSIAKKKFELFFSQIANSQDKLWSESNFRLLQTIYFRQRDADNCSPNITLRTLAGFPDNLQNEVKIMFLQMAEICCFFNASHKVNFTAEELPENYTAIKMQPGKTKGSFTYEAKMPSLYAKTSLTFDYWVPKIIEWTGEIREKGFKSWEGTDLMNHESCTDFMRISLMFLADTKLNLPIAKQDDRIKLMELLGKEFVWIKKSAKREDILGNNEKIKAGLQELNELTGIQIPFEHWNTVFNLPAFKPMFK